MRDPYVLVLNAEKCLDTWKRSLKSFQSAQNPSFADNKLEIEILWNVKTKIILSEWPVLSGPVDELIQMFFSYLKKFAICSLLLSVFENNPVIKKLN